MTYVTNQPIRQSFDVDVPTQNAIQNAYSEVANCCGKPARQCSCVARSREATAIANDNVPKPEPLGLPEWEFVMAESHKEPGIPGVNDPSRDGLNTPVIKDRPEPLGLPIMDFPKTF